MTGWWAPSFDLLRPHHPVFRNPQLIARWQKSRFCGHFSRAVVSDFRSLRGDIVFRPLLARQSPAAKIPFQTRRRRLITRVRGGEFWSLPPVTMLYAMFGSGMMVLNEPAIVAPI